MNTQIQSFNFHQNSIRTFNDEKGEMWFLANDICNVLGYTNSRKTISDHCKGKGVTKRYTPTESGAQEMVYINEPNLYRLIVKSRKPEAEKFEEWVMEEVLPTIRKTGSYNATAPALPAANPYRLTEQDERDVYPLAAYAQKLSQYFAKSAGVSANGIQVELIDRFGAKHKAFHEQSAHFYKKAVEHLHEQLDKLPKVEFAVSRADLLHVFERQCQYKQQFENWNVYQLQSWLSEQFFHNEQKRYLGFPTSLESASYAQLEKLVSAMQHHLGNDFKLLAMSQQEKQQYLPQLRHSHSYIGDVLFNFGAKNLQQGDVAIAMQEMTTLNYVFNTLLTMNYDDDFLNKDSMGKVKYANQILDELTKMLMEAAAETLQH